MKPAGKYISLGLGTACLLSLFGLAQGLGAEISEEELLRLAPLSLEELVNLPVVTASRQQEHQQNTPAHILVFTRQQIRERRYKNLSDLLEDLPGVDFMQGTKSSAYNNFSLQGYESSNKLLILLDGVRIGHPTGGRTAVAENFSLYMAERVEVLYGPAAALYGADAVSGVINIITDRAQDRAGSFVRLGTGSFDSQEGEFLTGLKGEKDIALTLGGHWQRSHRAPLDEYYPEAFAKKDARTFGGDLVIPAAEREDYKGPIDSYSVYGRLDAGKSLTLGYYRNHFRSLTSTGDPPKTALYLRTGHWETTSDTLYGKWRWKLSPQLSSEFIADYARQEVDPNSKYINIYTAFKPGYEYVLSQRFSLEENLSWRWQERHRLQGGFGYQKYSAIEAHSLPEPYDTNRKPNEQQLYYRNTDDQIPIPIQDMTYWNAFLYAQLHSDWSDQFSTMLGLRLDEHSTFGTSINPRLGLVWHPSEQQDLKLLYGESFRAPSTEEMLKSFGAFDGSKDEEGRYIGRGFRIPNRDLDPEKANTLELTWNWRPRKDLHLSLNAYYSEIEQLIVTDQEEEDNTEWIPGAVFLRPRIKENIGKAIHRGLDLLVQWQYRIDEDWYGDLWSSFGRVWGRTRENGEDSWELPYTADFRLKLGTTLHYRKALTITPKFYWIGDTTNGREDRENAPKRLRTPGYTLVNLHVGWHHPFQAPITLWLDCYNLLNARYYAAGGSTSQTFYDMPQQPRQLMISLEYSF